MINKSESIKNLAIALAKFQGGMATVKAKAENTYFSSKYADIADLIEAYRKPLSEQGLSLTQFPSGKNQIVNLLMHESGEFLEDIFEITPTKNDPQSLGSAITYGRRYSMGAILGIATEEDDDGNKASGNVNKEEEQTKKDFAVLMKKVKQLNLAESNEYKEKMSKSTLYNDKQKKEYLDAVNKHIATLNEVAGVANKIDEPKKK